MIRGALRPVAAEGGRIDRTRGGGTGCLEQSPPAGERLGRPAPRDNLTRAGCKDSWQLVVEDDPAPPYTSLQGRSVTTPPPHPSRLPCRGGPRSLQGRAGKGRGGEVDPEPRDALLRHPRHPRPPPNFGATFTSLQGRSVTTPPPHPSRLPCRGAPRAPPRAGGLGEPSAAPSPAPGARRRAAPAPARPPRGARNPRPPNPNTPRPARATGGGGGAGRPAQGYRPAWRGPRPPPLLAPPRPEAWSRAQIDSPSNR